MSFKKCSDRLAEIDDFRKNKGANIPYGVKYLDDALRGIARDDLILVTAKTGGGKTEFATSIAYNAAKLKKNVHFFALEAHRGEIECRIRFKTLAHAFYMVNKFSRPKETPDYALWMNNEQEHLFEKLYPEVDEIVKRELETMTTYYTDRDFNADTFEAEMSKIGLTTDLIIIDHLHYFDFDGPNENTVMKKTIKQIKNVVQFYRKPVILVTQLRKAERYSDQLLPEVDDIHGSSDVAKIATSVIVAGPARDQDQSDARVYPTYFRIAKNRMSGSRTFYTALCGYDISKNAYEEKYFLGKLINNGTEFQYVEPMEYPQWANATSRLVP